MAQPGAVIGRPSKIDQVVRVRDDGTEVTVAQQIIERVQLGADMAVAAESAGIDRVTLHRWRLAGARHRGDQARGKLDNPTPAEQALIAFCNSLESAENEAEVNRLAIIHRAATGGAKHAKTTEKYDASGALVERTVVTETLDSQWTAAAWWLERKRGYVKRYELTGAEGAPLVPQAEQARNLADSLRLHLEAAAEGAAAAKQVRGPRKKPAAKASGAG